VSVLDTVDGICCRTALAEAEIEYNDNYCSPSVYVKYQLQRLSDALNNLGNVADALIHPLVLNIMYFFMTLCVKATVAK